MTTFPPATASSVSATLKNLEYAAATTSGPWNPENTTADANGTDGFEWREQTPAEANAQRLASIFVPILFGLIFCVGIVGNSLVITVMTKIYKVNGQRLNNTNRFILNLAVSDLLFLTFCVPFHATVYTLDGWRFGGFMCIFTKVCEEMTKIASVYTLVALSVDRFLAVVYATSARQIRTRANAIRGLIFIWIAAAGLAAPTFITREYGHFNKFSLCYAISINRRKWYELSLTLLGYVIPLMIIIACYTGLLLVMCRTAKNSSITVSNSSNDSRKKVTKIVIMVVVIFAINWLPHHIVLLWMDFYGMEFNLATFVLRLLAHCMAYANACVNPLVYAFVSRKFRQDFKKAFTCQYISEAVGSVKAFSRRMIGTMRYSMQSSTNSNAETDGGNGRKGQGGVSRAINRNPKFCPRSPLTPLGHIPKNTGDIESSDNEGSPITRVTALTSFAGAATDFEQTALMDENGCAFDEDHHEDTV